MVTGAGKQMESIKRVQKQNRLLLYVQRRAFIGELLMFFTALLLGTHLPVRRCCSVRAGISGSCNHCDCNAHYTFLGAVFGAILLQSPPQYPAVCACILYYVIELLWSHWSPPVCKTGPLVSVVPGTGDPPAVFFAGDVQTLLRALINIGLCEFSALVMQSALRTITSLRKRHVLSDAEQVSISLFFGILLLSVTDVQAFGFSLPVVLLLVFSMIAALARGVSGVARLRCARRGFDRRR